VSAPLPVTSVVLNFGDPSATLACVERLGAFDYLQHSIVIVNDGSSPAHGEGLAARLDGHVLL
jgi:GT2 family glycosyltransferase